MKTARPDSLTVHCSRCAKVFTFKERAKPTPKGWKRLEDNLYCGDCWRSQYVLRAVTMPVASPLDLSWDDLSKRLKIAWVRTTQASNWIMTELYRRDERRVSPPPIPGEEPKDPEKMPPWHRPDKTFYHEVRHFFPELASQTVASLLQSTISKYNEARYKTSWINLASLPVFRYPTPLPVHNQSWSVAIENNRPIVTVRIGDPPGVRLRLTGGPNYRRQLAAVKQMVSGEATRGELAIYRQGMDTMCKLVAWLPRRPRVISDRPDILRVITMQEALVTAVNAKDEKLWQYHGDQLLRLIARHRLHLQRWADDSKAEHRPIPPFAERRRKAAHDVRNRLKTDCHTVARLIVNYAARRRFAGISYDDSDHSFCAEFPWFDLAQKIGEKADEAGLTFEHIAETTEKIKNKKNLPAETKV
jgi:hypothetical protein